MKTNVIRRFAPVGIAVLVAALGFTALSGTSNAAQNEKCSPVKPTGKTIGKITVDNVSLPIKAFTYPAGGVMKPQGSTLMAGLSLRHMPLNSTLGSSIIAWHRDFKGCWNTLNILFSKKVGSEISVTDDSNETRTYRITMIKTVSKGKYDRSWFDLIGPRKLVLVTCTGDFKNGHYANNLVVIAKPI